MMLSACRNLAMLLIAGGAYATPATFEAQAPIQLQGNGPYYRLTLPMQAMLAAHDPTLADLRMTNASGENIPFSLIRQSGHNEQQQLHASLTPFPLHGDASNANEPLTVQVERNTSGTIVRVEQGQSQETKAAPIIGYLLDASKIDTPLISLDIEWDAAVTGFQRIEIQGSDDLQHWRSLTDGQLARLEFNGQRISQQRIELNGTKARYLRLLWRAPANAPSLSKVSLRYGDQAWQPAPTVWSPPMQATRSAQNELTLNLPRAIVIDQLDIQLPQTNTLLPVHIAGKYDTKQPWATLTNGVVYRVQQGNSEWTHTQLALTGQPLRSLRIHADERSGGFGQTPPTLRIGSTAYQVIFLARGNPPYQLQIGQPSLKTTALPINTLVPGWGSSQAPAIDSAVLGTMQHTTEPTKQTAFGLAEQIDWKRAALWAVLLVGVGILGGMVWQLTRTKPKNKS
ncbi:DUF3999 domain-containing protein [Chitinivorax sp. B]|uniref:DUF3999 domain-containing protein n=1 Tax=Chitinivorax sp. B TaxID=2502235 RepID=UPI0010F67826|nr:DUF3999 domain-containing protein [Chitinivorax sp. B]